MKRKLDNVHDDLNMNIKIISDDNPLEIYNIPNAFEPNYLDTVIGNTEKSQRYDLYLIDSLHDACARGNIGQVNTLVESGDDINKTDRCLRTPMHIAISCGHPELALFILNKGGCVHAKDHNGETVIHYACKEGYIDIVRTLVDNNANVEVKNNQGMKPINLASRSGFPNIVNYLTEIINKQKKGDRSIRRGIITGMLYQCICSQDDHDQKFKELLTRNKKINVDKMTTLGLTLLITACVYGNYNIVEFLIKEKNANINLKDKQGMNAFHHCCDKKNIDLIELLYNNGADINSICNNGSTPLHWACDSSSPDIAMKLIDMGADIHHEDNEGRTPLIWAIDRNHNDLVKELIRKGADINVVDRYKKTALHWSCVRENIELIRLLLSKGLDINDRDVNGITALNIAVDANRIDIVEILLDNGADVFLHDDRRKLTPLMHAVKNGYVDIIEAIIQKGGKRIMYQGDNLLCKPLHWACLYGQLESIKILYDYGVDLNDQNFYQKTPLFFANENGYSNCVEYLVERGANVYVKDINHRLPLNDDKIIETFNSIWYTTPLMKAMIDGNIYEFRSLLCTENYQEINQTISDTYGYTVLHAAVHLGELQFVEEMTRCENVDFTKSTESKKRLSALHIACSKGNIDMIKLIRKRLIIE